MDDISYHSNNIQESIGHLRSVVVSSNKISDLISIESAASGLDSAITEGETALSKHSTLSEDDCATLRNTALETYHTSVPSIEMLPKLVNETAILFTFIYSNSVLTVTDKEVLGSGA